MTPAAKAASKAVEVKVGNRRLKLSNLDKVFYPAVGFTKGQVIDYYRRVAPALVPHLRNRPLTLKRYPDGVDGQFFYEKQCPSYAPGWIETVTVKNRREIDYCLANSLPTLIWLANLADLELHTMLSLAKDVTRPTMLVFDLDPGEPATIVECSKVGLALRDVFKGLGLDAYPKTSGSKGLQIYVPLNTPVTYDDTKPFAHAIARLLEKQMPTLVVSSQKKSLRGGKVLRVPCGGRSLGCRGCNARPVGCLWLGGCTPSCPSRPAHRKSVGVVLVVAPDQVGLVWRCRLTHVSVER